MPPADTPKRLRSRCGRGYDLRGTSPTVATVSTIAAQTADQTATSRSAAVVSTIAPAVSSRSAALATAYNATLPIATAHADDLPEYLRHSWRCSLPGRGLGCLWVHVRVWD